AADEVEDVIMGCANPEGATGANIAIFDFIGCHSRPLNRCLNSQTTEGCTVRHVESTTPTFGKRCSGG
ncbi:MAG: hypothetical protein EBX72_07405, partial [Betaproteobacteria bacterium]|nr:hypothetical protein [Betaproteobacteria bacterium]